MAVQELKNLEEFQKAIASSKLSVIDFHATWCGPCKAIAPKVQQFSEEFTDAAFYKIDVDEVPDVASKCEIKAMPTIQFYKDGKKIQEVVGANVGAIQQAVTANI